MFAIILHCFSRSVFPVFFLIFLPILFSPLMYLGVRQLSLRTICFCSTTRFSLCLLLCLVFHFLSFFRSSLCCEGVMGIHAEKRTFCFLLLFSGLKKQWISSLFSLTFFIYIECVFTLLSGVCIISNEADIFLLYQ